MPPNPEFTPTEPPAILTDETQSLKENETPTENIKESIVDSPVTATDSGNQVNTPEKKPLPKTNKKKKKIYLRKIKDAVGYIDAPPTFPHTGGKTKRSKRKAKKTKKAKRKGRKSKKSRKAKKH